jgi:hypothetical protein
VLERRTAVGEGFANLVHALGSEADLRTAVIAGHGRSAAASGAGRGLYTRRVGGGGSSSGTRLPTNHYWNAVFALGRWWHMDAAWAAGHIVEGQFKAAYDDTYWLLSPADMAVEHLPLQPGWQLLPRPLGAVEFVRQVPRGKAFFRHGLELLSHPAPTAAVRAQRQVSISIGHRSTKQPVFFRCLLRHVPNDASGNQVDSKLQKKHQFWRVRNGQTLADQWNIGELQMFDDANHDLRASIEAVIYSKNVDGNDMDAVHNGVFYTGGHAEDGSCWAGGGEPEDRQLAGVQVYIADSSFQSASGPGRWLFR